MTQGKGDKNRTKDHKAFRKNLDAIKCKCGKLKQKGKELCKTCDR